MATATVARSILARPGPFLDPVSAVPTVPAVEFLPAVFAPVPRDGAGVLFFVPTTQTVLLALRGGSVSEPFTWGVPGGLLDPDEDPAEAAFRELDEELGVTADDVVDRILDIRAHSRQKTGRPGTFTLFVVTLTEEINPDEMWLDHETLDCGWFLLDDARRLPLHSGTKADLEELF